MKVNENTIKVSYGKMPVDKEMEIGSQVHVMIEGEVVKIEETPNYDGTIDRCYIIKGIEGTYLEVKNGKS